jgi:quinol monooxygenase YgiN
MTIDARPLSQSFYSRSPNSIQVIALIYPKPGKAARVTSPHPPQELLLAAAAKVKDNEPGTLRYHLQKETKGDAPTFVMLET